MVSKIYSNIVKQIPINEHGLEPHREGKSDSQDGGRGPAAYKVTMQ